MLKNRKLEDNLKKLFDLLVFLIIFALITAICGIPTWIFIIAKNMLNPVGFWQNLALYGLGFYFLMGIQVLLFIAWVVILYTMIAALFSKN